jgi:hypothetical protein
MSLIFDRFETCSDAEAFANCVKEKYGRKASVYGSQAASEGVNGGNPWAEQPEPDQEEHDTFPFELDPPIVLVERLWAADQITRLKVEDEGAIIDEVEKYKGVFAGT